MARTTTNYGWNISEGSDLVNPLTDIFPNFESLDTDLKEVSDASIGEATELKTGTVHALTRTDTDKDVFKFTATSNFTAGDTFTVDTEQVSALTTSGEQLTTGCYIIGSEVLVAKKGTLLTFYISNVITDASTLEGHSASYFATASDLSDTDADLLAISNKVGSAILTTQAQDCSGAINELNAGLSSVLSFDNLELIKSFTIQGQTETFNANDYKCLYAVGQTNSSTNGPIGAPAIIPLKYIKDGTFSCISTSAYAGAYSYYAKCTTSYSAGVVTINCTDFYVTGFGGMSFDIYGVK